MHDKFSIEVGFGNGDFLIELASKELEYAYLGVEIASRSANKLTRKALARGLDNIKIIKLDAFMLFSILEPQSSVHRVIYNFPDPWPDKPERRITFKKHLLLIHRVLRKDGVFYLATDSDILKQDLLVNSKGIFNVEESKEPFFSFHTKYQKKWISEKRSITYYRLSPKVIKEEYPVIEYYGGEKMAHVVLEIKEERSIPRSLPKRMREKSLFFLINRPYGRENEYLFPVFVKEQGFVQKTYFRLYFQGKEARITLDDTAYIVVTKGIRKAMSYLRDMLLATGNYRVKRDTTIV